MDITLITITILLWCSYCNHSSINWVPKKIYNESEVYASHIRKSKSIFPIQFRSYNLTSVFLLQGYYLQANDLNQTTLSFWYHLIQYYLVCNTKLSYSGLFYHYYHWLDVFNRKAIRQLFMIMFEKVLCCVKKLAIK